MSPIHRPLVLLVPLLLWASVLQPPCTAATVPLQNAQLSGSTTLSGTLASGSSATVDLRLGNILLPSTPASALTNGTISGNTTLSGTLTSGTAATVDLRLGNILLPASATASNALTSGTITGNSIISSGTLSIGAATFISGTASTVDLRLGNILLPASATSGTSSFSGSNAVLSGTSSLASGTFTIASGATLLSAASSSVDLRLGTVQLPSSVSLLGQSIDLATEVSGTLQSANFPSSLPALNGSALTNLSASAISSGTVSAARLPVMTGDTGTGGSAGIVPAPASGDATKVLYGNGQWATPPGAAGGEANTASNLGTSSDGEGVFSAKSGVDLQFKRIKAGTNITLSTSGSSITINSTATSGTGSSSGSSLDGPDVFPSSPSSYDDEFTTAVSGSWSWFLSSSATNNSLAVSNGRLLMTYGTNSVNVIRVLERPAPSGNNFTVTTKVHLPYGLTGATSIRIGLMVRNSSTSSGRGIEIQKLTSFYVGSHDFTSSDTVVSGNATSDTTPNQIWQWTWLRIRCDGTNIITSYSYDGSSYRQHSSQALSSVVSNIDRIGIYAFLSTAISENPVYLFDYVRVTTP